NIRVSNTKLSTWGRQSLVIMKQQSRRATEAGHQHSLRSPAKNQIQRIWSRGNILRRHGSLRRTLPSLNLSSPVPGKATLMEPNQQVEAETELVTETLVEEVSIDGMCGVY